MADATNDREHIDKAVLFAALDSVDTTPHYLAEPVGTATRRTSQQLRIVLVSSLFNTDNVDRPEAAVGTKRWDAVQSTLTYIYVQATKVAQEMGKILMDVDVLLKGENESLPESIAADAEVLFRITGSDDALASRLPIPSDIQTVWLSPGEEYAHGPIPTPSAPIREYDAELPVFYPVVASGGTFDHLHAGHKILLSMGTWIARDKLIVGITDDAALQKKANKDVMQPLSTRIAHVRAFLEMFKPGVEYFIDPITDVAGPTGWDPNVQALVVSKETLNGAAIIAKIREEKGLGPLKTFVIDVISHTDASLDAEDAEVLRKTKMSSTFIREWIVQQRAQATSSHT